MNKKKKVLLVGNRFANKRGAEYSLLELRKVLEQETDYQIKVFTLEQENYGPEAEWHRTFKYPIDKTEKLPLTEEMKKTWSVYSPILCEELYSEIQKYQPDVVLAQNSSALPAVRACKEEGIDVGVWVHDYRFLSESYHEGRFYTKPFNYIASKLAERFRHEPIIKSDFILFNSKHTKERCTGYFKSELGISIDEKSEILYPVLDTQDFKLSKSSKGDKILHVNPVYNKGIETTLKVAEKLPDKNFIVTGSEGPQKIMEKIEDAENIEYKGYVGDIKDIYQETKIVLMPSKWEEPFGRVPVEAGINGIPTIAPARGGLKESVPGEHQVEDKPEAYRDKISEIEKDFERNSEISIKHAEKLIKDAKDSTEKIFASN